MSLDIKQVVRNLSSKSLTAVEEHVLTLGPNFEIVPKHISITEIIAATEATARSLDSQSVDLLRFGVSHALSKAKPPPANFDKKMHMAVKKMYMAVKGLEKDKDIVILPADKSNVTVMMDRSVYEEKLNDMLRDVATYRKLRRDLTTRIETKVK